MGRHRRTYRNIGFLIKDLRASIFQLSGYSKDDIVDFVSQLMACGIDFHSKMASYELMYIDIL